MGRRLYQCKCIWWDSDYSYEWSGPNVSGTDTQDLENLESGVFTLEVTDGNGCTAVQQFNIIFDNVIEIANGIELIVFPNPSNGVFNIQWSSNKLGDMQFSVIDPLGRIVESGVWSGVGTSFNTTLDLGSYENGVYRLSTISNGVMSSIQIVKAN